MEVGGERKEGRERKVNRGREGEIGGGRKEGERREGERGRREER